MKQPRIVGMNLSQVVVGDEIWRYVAGNPTLFGVVKEKQPQGTWGYCLVLDNGQRIPGSKHHFEWVHPRIQPTINV